MPCDRVANAVVEEPEPSEVAGGVHALREQPASSSVKLLVMPMRSETWMRK